MAQYGISYMGSKSSVCKKLVGLFSKAENFYDLFGGGFSVTHAMLIHRSKDFKHFHFNEIRPGVCDLVQDAIAGKYNYDVFKPEWISRERFFAEKESNAYIKLCWSFGNKGEDYLFGKKIEDQKKSLHMAVVFNQFDDFSKKCLGLDSFQEGLSITNRRVLVRQQLDRLQQLERLQRLTFSQCSYEQVDIKPNSVIYCDIPYWGTEEYDENESFDRKSF